MGVGEIGEEYRVTLKELPADVRPRERMLAAGPQALSNIELLAIILRTGTREETALELAQRVLGRGGLSFLGRISLEELTQLKGVGPAKACQVKAALELGRRLAAAGVEERPLVSSPQEVSNLVMEEMRYLDREHFRAVLLDSKNRVVAIEAVAVGILNSSLVHPREVFKAAVVRSAAAVILVHNHPSGDPSPSHDDIAITQRLVEAGKIIGIQVLDHIIIGDGKYCSLKERAFIS